MLTNNLLKCLDISLMYLGGVKATDCDSFMYFVVSDLFLLYHLVVVSWCIFISNGFLVLKLTERQGFLVSN